MEVKIMFSLIFMYVESMRILGNNFTQEVPFFLTLKLQIFFAKTYCN